MMGKKIFQIQDLLDRRMVLTGASGFLGSYVCQKLVNFKNLIPVSHTHPVSGFSLGQSLDLSEREVCHALLNSVRPEVIIHAAAETNVEKCEQNPPVAIRTNVDMTHHLVEWVREQVQKPFLVFISTDQLYNGPGPHREDNIFPRNVYALTKYAAEAIVKRCPNFLILRVNFVGWSPRRTGLVNWFLEGVQRQESLVLVDDVKFNPLAAADLVNLILQLIGRRVRGTYNLGASGHTWSKAEFCFRLGKELGLDLSTVRVGRLRELAFKAMRPCDMTMDVGPVEAVLDYPLPTLEDSVKQLVCEAKTRGIAGC